MPGGSRKTKRNDRNKPPAADPEAEAAKPRQSSRKKGLSSAATEQNNNKLKGEDSSDGVDSPEVPKSRKRKNISKNTTKKCSPSVPVPEKVPEETNVLKCLDRMMYGDKRDRYFHMKTVRNNMVNKSITQLVASDYAGKFTRRITALAWHEAYPYTLASASKFGDIMFICGVPNPDGTCNEFPVDFVTKVEVQGGGPGCSVSAMKFSDRNKFRLYRSSIDCTVAAIDFGEQMKTTVFYDTGDHYRWFCSLDANFSRNLLIAGDNKGTVCKFGLDGTPQGTWRLHNNKIHHCEFSKHEPDLLVTSSLDKANAVRIWDIRKISSTNPIPLQTLPHNSALNCAKFNPVDGSRLMTSDQLNEIRIYQGPLWDDYKVINHHHKQFQHITPIKADWHPVNDYIVIGRYPPRNDTVKQNTPRAIEFFDSYTGELVDAIYPPLNEICSLNVFNPTGEFLATGMNSKLILWKPNLSLYAPGERCKVAGEQVSKVPLSDAKRNILRGNRGREYSPVSDDDDEDTTSKKKRARTTTTTATSSVNHSTKKGKKK